MKQKAIFVMALLCLYLNTRSQCVSTPCFPSTQTVHDIFFEVACGGPWTEMTSNHIKISREYSLHDSISIHIPTIPTSIIYTDPNDDGNTALCDVSVSLFIPVAINDTTFFHALMPVVSKQIVPLLSPQEFTEIGFIVELHKTTGGDFMGKEQKLFEIYHKPNTSAFNDFNSDYSYVSPDTIWSVSVDDYAPPCNNAYTMDTCEFLSKYATPSSGEAQLYVKLGEGNEEITRPLIFVEGIDFDETTYTDVDGNIIRHGGNG